MRKALVLVVALVWASCSPRAVPTSSGTPDYDAATEAVLSGKVEQVVLHVHDGPPVVHLIVAVNGKSLVVHLAPPSFLKEQGFEFRAGDQVEIVASLQKNEPHYHARAVTKESRTLTLRDSKGFPLWEDRRKKQ